MSPFAGQKLMLAAISTTNSTSQATSPIKLLAATDDANLTLLDTRTNAGANTFVDVPAGDYIFDVAPDTNSNGDSVYASPSLSLAQGVEYTVVAAGYVLTTPAFGLLATADNNRSVATQASVKVVHAAPVAGTVDVYVTVTGQFASTDIENGLAGDPLLYDFTFGTITDYVSVTPDNYDIRVVAGGTLAINRENINQAPGSVSTVIAHEPIDSGTPGTLM